MANHIEILRQGVEVWNKWRSNNPHVTPIFERYNLDGTDFRKAHLQRALFTGASCIEAKFQEANLQKANFRGADLAFGEDSINLKKRYSICILSGD